jgi:hypothetical protein
MKRLMYLVLKATLLLATAGCAVSSERFYSDRGSFGAVSLCRTHKSALERGQYQLARDVENELRGRLNKELHQCEKIISDSNAAIAAGVVAAALVVAAASSDSAGSSGGGNTTTASSDYDWDWDEFYDQYGTLIWRCRGIQTARFAEDYKCAGDWKTDVRWPSKSADQK